MLCYPLLFTSVPGLQLSRRIAWAINQRPNCYSNPLLYHHHQGCAKYSSSKFRSNALVHTPKTTFWQLFRNHLRNCRLHLGITIGTLKQHLGPEVRVCEHCRNDSSKHSKEEGLSSTERFIDNCLAVGFESAGCKHNLLYLFIYGVLNGRFETKDNIGLDTFIEATNSLVLVGVGWIRMNALLTYKICMLYFVLCSTRIFFLSPFHSKCFPWVQTPPYSYRPSE